MSVKLISDDDPIRYFKEEKVYRDEVKAQEKVVSKLKEDGADGADIRAAVSGWFKGFQSSSNGSLDEL